jgi:hypothetical protein
MPSVNNCFSNAGCMLSFVDNVAAEWARNGPREKPPSHREPIVDQLY